MKAPESAARKPSILPFAAVIFCLFALAGPARAQDEAAPASAQDEAEAFDPWKPGSQWMSLRAGYAKSTEDSSGHGAGGYGMSYRRMISGLKLYKWTLFRKYSIGASVQHDLVGRFGPAAEIDVAATLELVRHYKWGPNIRPYLGVGVGPYYRKTYRTGNDLRDLSVGWLLTTGVNTPVTPHHLLGFDIRMSRLDGKNDPPNPVFGLGSVDRETSLNTTTFTERPVTHWSIKVGYSFAY